jgi:hypothetical protein
MAACAKMLIREIDTPIISIRNMKIEIMEKINAMSNMVFKVSLSENPRLLEVPCR